MKRLDSLCRLIFNIYEAHTVAIYKRESNALRCLSFYTLSTNFTKWKTLSLDESLAGWVLRHKEPLIIANFSTETGALGYYEKDEEIKSFMAYPIGEVGVICLDSKKKYSFTDKEKKNLAGFIPLIIEEIEEEDKGSELEEKINELNTKKFIFSMFRDLLSKKLTIRDLLFEALRLSGGDTCFVGLEKGRKLEIKDAVGIGATEYNGRISPIGESIASSVIEGGGELLLPFDTGYFKEKPLIFEGEVFRARQFFGFPLLVEDIVFGVLGFATSKNRPLFESSITTLRDISTMLSMYYSALWTKEYLEKLKEADPVTGALQFNYFLRIAEELIKKPIKFALLKVALLNIRTFNRERGIDFTEEVLRKAYHLIVNISGGTSFVARKSGGKFYLIFPRKDPSSVKNTAKIIDYTIFKAIYECYNGKTKFERKEEAVQSRLVFFPEDGVELASLLEKLGE
ncbi:MAG: GAF domain-containing protein [Desulfobacterota bacterium]|nr:GAF domain-containing protein [Thermodesulfobacteriota bacterium]MDW8001959.1 GAF domain-containing protein [Deltaproteobacteria bacterium]